METEHPVQGGMELPPMNTSQHAHSFPFTQSLHDSRYTHMTVGAQLTTHNTPHTPLNPP